MSDISKSTKEFLKSTLVKGLREDGRGLLELRALQIIFNFENDGVEVCNGDTRVYAKIKSEIVEPKSERPNEGFLTFRLNLQILGESTQDKTNSKASLFATEVEKMLERSIKGSKAFDCDSLCVQAGKFVWDIVVELTIINNDGNIIDTINYATIIALTRYKKPFVGIENNVVRIYSPSEKATQFLSIHFLPIMLTFGVYNGEKQDDRDENDYILLDPTRNEEEIINGRITITMNIYKDILAIHMPGGATVKPNLVSELTRFCGIKSTEITKMLRDYLKNVEENTLEIYKEDGFINFDLFEVNI